MFNYDEWKTTPTSTEKLEKAFDHYSEMPDNELIAEFKEKYPDVYESFIESITELLVNRSD